MDAQSFAFTLLLEPAWTKQPDEDTKAKHLQEAARLLIIRSAPPGPLLVERNRIVLPLVCFILFLRDKAK